MKCRRLPRVLVIGGGELGSAVSHRLRRSGMDVFIVELENPRCIRRNVCFASAMEHGEHRVEGVCAMRARSLQEAKELVERGVIPVLCGHYVSYLKPLGIDVVVDARMLKRCDSDLRKVADLVIGLGPGHIAGDSVDVVIETMRGHDLGRVIYSGTAFPNTGIPGEIKGHSADRVIRAPASGTFKSLAKIGEIVKRGDLIGKINDSVCVLAPIDGLLRGLVSDGLNVRKGEKIGDVDPRGLSIDPNTISDKGRAVSGGVLEAILAWWSKNGRV